MRTVAVFRVEKNHNYTVMSNYHLRDTALTLKAIGLLSKMLSLTDEWDYTTRGLAAICKEGVDAIGAALKELELHGYRDAFYAKSYDGFTINKHTEIWKARNAKDPKYGYGVLISKTWYWYESWAKEIEKYCKTHSDEVK